MVENLKINFKNQNDVNFLQPKQKKNVQQFFLNGADNSSFISEEKSWESISSKNLKLIKNSSSFIESIKSK